MLVLCTNLYIFAHKATLMKETLSTISKRTGVSISTISRILSGKAEKYRISSSTVSLIKAEAKRCGYQPLHVEKNLRSGRIKTIGLLVPSLRNPFFAEIASIVISEAGKKNYTTIVLDTMEDVNVLKKEISTLVDKKVDGIIVVPCGEDSTLLEQVNRNIFPVVLVDRYYDNCDLCFMTTNNFQGGINAVNHLLLHGHKKIACIQGVPESMPNIERVAGYKKAMTEAGYNDSIVVTGNEFTIRNGYLSTKLLLRDKDQFSAIFALSNTIMLGALKAVREAGLRVPEDISIISFDDYYYLDFMEPPITRICQPTDEMCNMAVRVLFEKIEKKRDGVTQIRFSPTLKEGKSVYYLK